jgi:hypothetical protein
MSRYWNKVILEKWIPNSSKEVLKYKFSTDYGRGYVFFERNADESIAGKVVFFPRKSHGNFSN